MNEIDMVGITDSSLAKLLHMILMNCDKTKLSANEYEILIEAMMALDLEPSLDNLVELEAYFLVQHD